MPPGSTECIYVVVAAFILSAAVFPLYIRWLKSKQYGQYIREEGPQSHQLKAKTPTMGGLCFIAVSTVVAAVSLFLFAADRLLIPVIVIVLSALCGLVGFADDFAKVTSRSNTGLSAKSRLLIEFALGGLLGGAVFFLQFGGQPSLYNVVYCFALTPFLVAATTNAINLHDGMDGLAGGTSIQVFTVLAVMLVLSGQAGLALVASALIGAIGGFLIYNKYKAKVFMGDTGSLFIGGALAGLVASSGTVLWFIPLALIYIIETISVMIQVIYFKLTKEYVPEKPMSKLALIKLKLTKRLPGEGKRFFRMAPLHHHFEAVGEEKGVREWQVVAYFWLAQFLICSAVLVAYLQLTMRH